MTLACANTVKSQAAPIQMNEAARRTITMSFGVGINISTAPASRPSIRARGLGFHGSSGAGAKEQAHQPEQAREKYDRHQPMQQTGRNAALNTGHSKRNWLRTSQRSIIQCQAVCATSAERMMVPMRSATT